MLVRRREKARKYFDLLAVKEILALFNLSSTLDVVSFQKGEPFSASQGTNGVIRRAFHVAFYFETNYSNFFISNGMRDMLTNHPPIP